MMLPQSNNETPYKIVLLLTAAALCLYFIKKWDVLLYSAATLSIASLLSHRFAKSIDYIWRKIAWLLSLVLPKLLLTFVFYLVLTPLALLSRLNKKSDPLQLKKVEGTVFREVEIEFEKKDFEKPW